MENRINYYFARMHGKSTVFACAAIEKALQHPGEPVFIGESLLGICRRLVHQFGLQGLTFGRRALLGPYMQFDKVEHGNQGA